MAYATGTAANPAALQGIIENFAVANGFTLNAGAGSWLSKGNSHVRLTPYTKYLGASITRSGTTATLVDVGTHGLVTGNVVTITGASDPLYNGTFTITGYTSATFTYTMSGTPASNAVSIQVDSKFDYYSNTNTSLEYLNIFAANSSDGLTEFCPFAKRIFVAQASWPITYYLFYSSSPDQILCVIQHDVDYIQTIIFGDIVKINNSAYVGGNWFFASRGGPYTTTNSGISSITDTRILCTQGTSNPSDIAGFCVPFASGGDTGSDYGRIKGFCEGINAKIDGHLWHTIYDTYKSAIGFTDYTYQQIFRSPNTWNSQAHLVPMHLTYTESFAGYQHYLGYVEHLRLIRIDNYNIGDIITLGTDYWKVFPWRHKDTTYRDGTTINNASGTLGFAVRYVV